MAAVLFRRPGILQLQMKICTIKSRESRALSSHLLYSKSHPDPKNVMGGGGVAFQTFNVKMNLKRGLSMDFNLK